jgi:hypothetical protein
VRHPPAIAARLEKAMASMVLSFQSSPSLPDMKTAPTEQTGQADNNQIDCDDQVQQIRHKQNENARDQRNQRGKAHIQVDVHVDLLGYSLQPASFFLRDA